MDKNEFVTIRPPRLEDVNYILSSWLKGLKYGNSWFNEIDPKTYYSYYEAFIKKILQLPDTDIKVSCLKEDPDVIVGYSISRRNQPILYWVFVKPAWRKIGIAKSLINPDTKIVTHLTKVGLSILRKSNKAIFNPFI